MKKRRSASYPPLKNSTSELKETAPTAEIEGAPMIRTQIYLNQREYDFVQAEAARRDEPMAAVIRDFIDEKMKVPEDAWTNNPMLKPTPKDAHFHLPEDAAINHDHYLYGTPKKYVKAKGRWVPAQEARD